MARVATSYEMGVLTNGPVVREFEELAAECLGAPYAVAVSSCTAGLMLVAQALFPNGPVLLPSFTFTASAHGLAWNGQRPLFAECHPATLQLDVMDARARLGPAGGILATHVFGAPCPAKALEELGRARRVPVVFDAAHAFGARHHGRRIGSFGDASVFSLTPTKPVAAGEGGVVTTRHADLAERLRIGRDYGNAAGDYDTLFVGLNARMSEFHAAMAIESMAMLGEHIEVRTAVAARYRRGLAALPGIEPQEVLASDTSTYKDFSVLVEPPRFGMSRNVLVRALAAEGIDTRNYFDPPVHRQRAYLHLNTARLPVTEDVAGRVVSLPIFARMPEDAVDRVVETLITLHHHADEIAGGGLTAAPTMTGT
jgi:dTDP-4-amino-4,6-dideoxygalactose transaminase